MAVHFWLTPHALCILAHIGLVVASVVASFTCSHDYGQCGKDSSAPTLPWGSFTVGSLVMAFNCYLITSLYRQERASSSLTSEKRRFGQSATLLVGVIFNVVFFVADVAFAVTFLAKGYAQLEVVCAFAAIAAVAALVTLVADIVRMVELTRQGTEAEEALIHTEAKEALISMEA